jgi:hypothetical protein
MHPLSYLSLLFWAHSSRSHRRDEYLFKKHNTKHADNSFCFLRSSLTDSDIPKLITVSSSKWHSCNNAVPLSRSSYLCCLTVLVSNTTVAFRVWLFASSCPFVRNKQGDSQEAGFVKIHIWDFARRRWQFPIMLKIGQKYQTLHMKTNGQLSCCYWSRTAIDRPPSGPSWDQTADDMNKTLQHDRVGIYPSTKPWRLQILAFSVFLVYANQE